MKIYVLFYSMYMDYDFIGAFSTEAMAWKYVEKEGWNKLEYDVAEHTVDYL